MFPAQLFSFLLLFAWHVQIHGPEVNVAQHSSTKHKSLELFLSGTVCFKGVIIVRGCTNKAKVTSFGLMEMEASAFSGWL